MSSCLCIAPVVFRGIYWFLSGAVYASVDQGAEVPPPHRDDPYYQPYQQGKRNPPSEHILSYVSADIFSTIILHAVPNVNFIGLEYPIVALRFRCHYLFSLLLSIGLYCWPEILNYTMLLLSHA